jgi:hypothetical protein
MDEQLVLQFMEITGCSEYTEAETMLEAFAGDMDGAIQMYLSSRSGPSSSANARPMDPSRMQDYADDDDAFAVDEPRAPIPNRVGRLVDDSPPVQHSRPSYFPPMPSTSTSSSSSTTFAPTTSSSTTSSRIPTFASTTAIPSSPSESQPQPQPHIHPNMQAPTHLSVSVRSIEDAKSMALSQFKYLLVCVSDPTDFASLALNRDVWRHEMIQQLVPAHFVFWYLEHRSSEGQDMLLRYKKQASELPWVAILDPRTGAVVKEYPIAKARDPAQFALLLMSFAEQYTIEDETKTYTDPTKYAQDTKVQVRLEDGSRKVVVVSGAMPRRVFYDVVARECGLQQEKRDWELVAFSGAVPRDAMTVKAAGLGGSALTVRFM